VSNVIITDRSDTYILRDAFDLTDIFWLDDRQKEKSERNHWKDIEKRHSRRLRYIPHKPKKEVLLWLR